jgi:hypothetical protein
VSYALRRIVGGKAAQAFPWREDCRESAQRLAQGDRGDEGLLQEVAGLVRRFAFSEAAQHEEIESLERGTGSSSKLDKSEGVIYRV